MSPVYSVTHVAGLDPVRSLSHRERGGVRGLGLTTQLGNPLTPALSPSGERELTEFAASSMGTCDPVGSDQEILLERFRHTHMRQRR
jgi:hypothetical protein